MSTKLGAGRFFQKMSVAWEFTLARQWSRKYWKLHRRVPKGAVGEMMPPEPVRPSETTGAPGKNVTISQ
jgi:hypothetical protein